MPTIPPPESTPAMFAGVLTLALKTYRDRPEQVQLVAERLRDQMHIACPDLDADQMGRTVVAASVALASPTNMESREGQAMLQALSLLGGALLQEAADG